MAQRGDGKDTLHIHPIQVSHCRAPEVLLGTGWSYPADIWSFGIMIWDLLAGQELFQNIYNKDGNYSARHHLAEMVALLGPIPEELIKREQGMRRWRWDPPVANPQGKLCNNAADFFGGPFFDDQGEFVGGNLTPYEKSLRKVVPECISDEAEIEFFLKFMRRMLCWLPEERATAEELKQDPWLRYGLKRGIP